MPVRRAARRTYVLLSVSLCALALAACGASTTTAGFSGEKHEVAQAIANLQGDATAGEENKICGYELAGAIVARLGGAKACEKAVKSQLGEVDSLEVSIQSVEVTAAGRSATAVVKAVREGKKHDEKVALVKERGRWRISALG